LCDQLISHYRAILDAADAPWKKVPA